MRARRFFLSLLLLVTGLLGAILPAGAAPEKAAGGIRFTYKDSNAKSVAWAGAFNNWSTTANAMTKGEGGVWSIVIALPAGEQQYKFVVDGTNWIADPENSATAGDFGNSVVKIGADGEMVRVAATSNTPYSPKIFMGGRVIGLYQSNYNSDGYRRFELTSPEMNIDLGFDIRMSDVLSGKFLLNVDPTHEAVQDYRSRLNFKRGSLLASQPDLKILAFDSENIGTWDDPMHLVGDIGQFHHPYGWQRTGFQVSTPRFGFDTQALYTDNFQTGGLEWPYWNLDRGTNRKFTFEQYPNPSDPNFKFNSYLLTQRTPTGFVLVPGQVAKLSTQDVGDDNHNFGYGDGNTNVFALRTRRAITKTLSAGLLGRSSRGYGLGQLRLAEVRSDSSYELTSALTVNESYGAGVELKWQPSSNACLFGELLSGAQRLVLVNGAYRQTYRDTAIGATLNQPVAIGSTGRTVDGQHYTTDRSTRVALGGEWTFASGDVTVRGRVEHATHRYPAWTQAPIPPAGSPTVDQQHFENVDFQRGIYTDLSDLENRSTEWRFGWDRNWRYYLGREVKTTLDVTWTNFRYDDRTAWSSQLWFPTGNFWLESGQHVVSIDRLTVLGQKQVVELHPAIQVPLRHRDAMRLDLAGDYTGTSLGRGPRYAATTARFGFDLNRPIRLQTDWRWAKYDAPELSLGSGYVSAFTEAIYRFADDIQVSLGFGVDPSVLDPNTNEYAPIGRDVFLNQLNANGYVAQTNWLSLAPQISAAEKRLETTRRIQLKAIVHF